MPEIVDGVETTEEIIGTEEEQEETAEETMDESTEETDEVEEQEETEEEEFDRKKHSSKMMNFIRLKGST